jgi:hypothetical protein
VKATVRVVDGWPADFWDTWCLGVVVVERIDYVVEVMVADDEGYSSVVEVVVAGDEECGYVVAVAEGGWRWVDAAFGLAVILASIPVGNGCRRYTITL